MAQVLGVSYDQLVSMKLDPSLSYLESALASPLLQEFPFEEFGLEISTLVNLLTRAPVKASALIHAIVEVSRRYDLKEEHFLWAALRSYQELHDNYFPEVEEAAATFAAEHGLQNGAVLSLAQLEEWLTGRYHYTLDWERLAQNPTLATYRSVMVPEPRPLLLVNSRLHDNQIKFLLARELGYQYLGLHERSYTSSPDAVESFQQVYNDFRASYFAGALLMPREEMLADLRTFFALPTWQPDFFSGLLEKYDVTPEMLLYRFSELIPQFFGMKLHFLRFHSDGREYHLIKQLNMNRLLLPNGMARYEHFCRRWLTVRLLRETAALQPNGRSEGLLHVGVQMSRFYEAGDRFLCMGFSRPLVLQPHITSSVIVGLRMDGEPPWGVNFAQDPAVPVVVINQTCERCPLTPEECTVRAAPPVELAAQQRRAQRRQALQQLMAEGQMLVSRG